MSNELYTIVSLCNYAIVGENKPTVQHEPVTIPAAENGKPGLFVVKPGVCWEFMGASDKAYNLMARDISSKELAEAIVDDYCRAQICIENGAKPGIFAVKGEYTDPEEVAYLFEKEIKAATEKHVLWSKQLIARADDEWATEQKRRRIGASMIHAANFLGVDRTWVDPAKFEATAITCTSCRTKLHPDAVICYVCRYVVNKEKYETLEYA